MKEIWKDVKDFEGCYQVSNLGNVKSFQRSFPAILKPRTNKYGYRVVICSSKDNRKSFLIHRLVALAFIENPKGKRCVNHKDCDKTNNKLENLEWSTYSENNKHAYDNGLHKNMNGSMNNNNKLSEGDVLAIRWLFKGKFSNKYIADIFGVNPVNVSDIKRNKIWKWLKNPSSWGDTEDEK